MNDKGMNTIEIDADVERAWTVALLDEQVNDSIHITTSGEEFEN